MIDDRSVLMEQGAQAARPVGMALLGAIGQLDADARRVGNNEIPALALEGP